MFPKGAGALMGAEVKPTACPFERRAENASGGGRGQGQGCGTGPPTKVVAARASGSARHRGRFARGDEGSRGSRHACCLVLCCACEAVQRPLGVPCRAARWNGRDDDGARGGNSRFGAPRNAPLRTGRCRVRRLRSSFTIATFTDSTRPASDHKPASFPHQERATNRDDRHDRMPESFAGPRR